MIRTTLAVSALVVLLLGVLAAQAQQIRCTSTRVGNQTYTTCR